MTERNARLDDVLQEEMPAGAVATSGGLRHRASNKLLGFMPAGFSGGKLLGFTPPANDLNGDLGGAGTSNISPLEGVGPVGRVGDCGEGVSRTEAPSNLPSQSPDLGGLDPVIAGGHSSGVPNGTLRNLLSAATRLLPRKGGDKVPAAAPAAPSGELVIEPAAQDDQPVADEVVGSAAAGHEVETDVARPACSNGATREGAQHASPLRDLRGLRGRITDMLIGNKEGELSVFKYEMAQVLAQEGGWLTVRLLDAGRDNLTGLVPANYFESDQEMASNTNPFEKYKHALNDCTAAGASGHASPRQDEPFAAPTAAQTARASSPSRIVGGDCDGRNAASMPNVRVHFEVAVRIVREQHVAQQAGELTVQPGDCVRLQIGLAGRDWPIVMRTSDDQVGAVPASVLGEITS